MNKKELKVKLLNIINDSMKELIFPHKFSWEPEFKWRDFDSLTEEDIDEFHWLYYKPLGFLQVPIGGHETLAFYIYCHHNQNNVLYGFLNDEHGFEKLEDYIDCTYKYSFKDNFDFASELLEHADYVFMTGAGEEEIYGDKSKFSVEEILKLSGDRRWVK